MQLHEKVSESINEGELSHRKLNAYIRHTHPIWNHAQITSGRLLNQKMRSDAISLFGKGDAVCDLYG